MDELIAIMQELLEETKKVNENLEEIKGSGLYNGISDLYEQLENIKGIGAFDSINDLYDVLDDIRTSLNNQ